VQVNTKWFSIIIYLSPTDLNVYFWYYGCGCGMVGVLDVVSSTYKIASVIESEGTVKMFNCLRKGWQDVVGFRFNIL
jgi:hypothetical protein